LKRVYWKNGIGSWWEDPFKTMAIGYLEPKFKSQREKLLVVSKYKLRTFMHQIKLKSQGLIFSFFFFGGTGASFA
jgi:hypothetical protein